MKKVGVIGMGVMGSGMAITLAGAGYDVTVFNRTKGKCGPVQEAGASVANSVGEVARCSEAIVVMVSDDEAVEQVVLGDGGVLQHARAGTVVIDSSTVHPDTSRKLAEQLATKRIDLLDAPVTGGPSHASEGQLFFVIGGNEAVYQRCQSLFEVMGRRNLYAGATGSGAAAKLGNNMLCAVFTAAIAESMVTVKRFGLDPTVFFELISNSGGKSAMTEWKGPKMLEGDYSSQFALPLMAKDARLAKKLVEQMDVPSNMIAAASGAFAHAVDTVPNDYDFSGIYLWYDATKTGSRPVCGRKV